MPAAALRWQKLKYHGLQGASRVRGEYCMIPAAFAAKLAEADYEEEAGWAQLKLKGGGTLRDCQRMYRLHNE